MARKGQQTVKVSSDRFDKKEGTTYLATISMDPNEKVPLFIVAKGTTEGCEKKYELDECEDKLAHTKNGWTTTDLMIKYLNWVSERIEGRPCALLIDSYRAHKQQKVIEEAKRLNIELLFIPSCGTSIFQPLDRFVFGVLKKKLRSNYLQIDDSNYKERHRMVHKIVNEIWTQIQSDLIKKAWEIPGLPKYSYPDPDDQNDHDYVE